jgi:signal peptidase I
VSKVKRGSIAFLLSIAVPGLGQVYNGQPLTGILLAAAFVSLIFFASLLGLLRAFGSAVAYAIASWAFQLAVAIHAAVVAVRQVKNNAVRVPTRRSYALGTLVLCAAVITGLAFPDRIFGLRGYRYPTESMSPTLAEGDRFAVDVRYYKTHRPKRGDVIAFEDPTSGALLVKRVIAVEGDTIQGGPDGTIVNGRLLSEPYTVQVSAETPVGSNPKFGPISIPSNKLFVMGDNRGNSYDSRYFGFVDVSQVKGKPLYIYYSPRDKGRIGHAIQ